MKEEVKEILRLFGFVYLFTVLVYSGCGLLALIASTLFLSTGWAMGVW